MKNTTAIAARFLMASGLCLALAAFSGVGANAQGKMSKDKSAKKMSKPMMAKEDKMMDGDHSMGMMMDSDGAMMMMSSPGYPFAAPGSMTACTYSDMCDMMSMHENKMMHGGHMKMMEDDPMMMEHHMMSMPGYPVAAPGLMMSYDEREEMMHGDKKMGKDGMMMHDDHMMMEDDMSGHHMMTSHGYPYSAPGTLMSRAEQHEMMEEESEYKKDKMDHMDKPMKMKKEKMMKKGM